MRKDQLQSVSDPAAVFSLFEEYVAAWLEPMDLHGWVVELAWDADESLDADWASCSAEAKYKRARVVVNPKKIAEEGFTPLQIESIGVHELAHCILWPGYNEIANPNIPEDVRSYFEEIAADQIAHALLMAKYRGAEEVKKLWQGYKVVRPVKKP